MIQLVPANRNKTRARGGMTYEGQPGSAGGSGCSLAIDSDRLLPVLMITWLWAGCDSVPTRRQTTRAGDDLSLAAVNRAAIAAKGWQRRSGRRPAPAAAPAERRPGHDRRVAATGMDHCRDCSSDTAAAIRLLLPAVASSPPARVTSGEPASIAK